MKSYFSLLLVFLFLMLQSAVTSGQNVDYGDVLGQRINTITTAVPFLMIAPDARAGALGDAGVSSSPDINSMHWNPAKYAFMEQEMGFALNYTPWLRSLVPDINLSYLSGFRRLDDLQTIAFSLKYFTLGDVNFTDEVGTPMGTVRPNEFALDLAYARRLGDHISGAIAARFIYSDLTQGQLEGSQAGVSLAADVAVYYRRELNWEGTPTLFSAGAHISNMGNKITYTDDINADFIPINLRFGPSLTFDLDNFNQLSVMVDFNKLLVPTPPIYARDSLGNVMQDDDGFVIAKGRNPNRSVVSGMLGSFSDAPGGFREELNEFTISAGVEYWYDQQFAIRGGYFYEHESKGNRKYFTVGLGLKYNVFGLDFAYVIPVAQRSPLENVLRFSLSFDFEALRGQ
ncbi:MAG: type IX secretion system outer membrane channel protein PorV [Bacteroidales bacterium]|nr:type IX secretion system outer membrane channel protein PorV [Bacteroidales bacterium]